MRTKKRAPRWRPLSDADMENILGEVGVSLGDNARRELLHRVNEKLAEANKLAAPVTSSGEHIKNLRKVRDAARRLEAALQPFSNRQLAWAIDALAGHPASRAPATIEQLRREYPEWDEGVLQLAQARGVPVPSIDAMREAALGRYLVGQIGAWALMAEVLEHARMDHGGPGVRRPGKQDDDALHWLINRLGEVFEHTFGAPAATTRNSAWYGFLAVVLARSEGTLQLTDDQVHDKVVRASRHERQAEEAARAILARTIEREDQVGFRSKKILH